ncbi:hypothetical protein AHAS_Ahas01G0115100 [Arachis hypogaea]
MLYSLVERFMVHGPCGVLNPKDKTMIDEARVLKYMRPDNNQIILKKNICLDNWFIVSYIPKLLAKYGCHINVEYSCQSAAIKYLFKYVHKGNDRVTVSFFKVDDGSSSIVQVDEI